MRKKSKFRIFLSKVCKIFSFGKKRKQEPFVSMSIPNDALMANKPYTFRIKNNDEKDTHTARLFAAADDLLDEKQHESIELQLLNGSHRELKLQLLSEEFHIEGLKIQVQNKLQFMNQWKITKKRANGMSLRKVYTPALVHESDVSNTINFEQFELHVDKNIILEIPINPLEEVVITFNVIAEFNFYEFIKNSFWTIFYGRKNKK